MTVAIIGAGVMGESLLSGLIMVFWIIGEVASIRGFHVLQVVYLVTGVLVIWFTPSSLQRVLPDS